jgi:hypothetical protein
MEGWSTSGNNKGHFTEEAEIVFVPVWPRIEGRWLKHHVALPPNAVKPLQVLKESASKKMHINLLKPSGNFTCHQV